jgi:transcriptional regulator of met regulon
MSDYSHQYYQAYYELQKESEGNPKRHYVRISFRPRVIKTGTNELSNNYVEKYKTLSYEYSQEAFAHAYGWVDCGLFKQPDPDKEEDSRKEAYSRVRESQERLSFLDTSEEELTEALKKEKEKWEKRLEKAYIEGWEAYKEGDGKKLIDEDVDD